MSRINKHSNQFAFLLIFSLFCLSYFLWMGFISEDSALVDYFEIGNHENIIYDKYAQNITYAHDNEEKKMSQNMNDILSHPEKTPQILHHIQQVQTVEILNDDDNDEDIVDDDDNYKSSRYILQPTANKTSDKTNISHSHKLISQLNNDKNNSNLSFVVPSLWIVSPTKSATTSTVQGLFEIAENWDSPTKTKTNEDSKLQSIWSHFIADKYSKKLDEFLKSVYLQTIHLQHNLDQYPFMNLLLSIDPHIDNGIRHNIAHVQNREFRYGIREHSKDEHHVTVIKTPQNFYSPFVPIIFAHYISSEGTKVLITLRNPVHRIISWFCMFYLSSKDPFDVRAERALGRFPLLHPATNNTMLKDMRNMILCRNNSMDDIQILNAYFRFYVRFYMLHKKCKSHFIFDECNEINIANGTLLHRQNIWRHPIHMLFSGLLYPHLLLWMNVYQQQHFLGSRLRFMSFSYLKTNSSKALNEIKCWTEGSNICDTNNVDMPHLNYQTKPFPVDTQNELNVYFEPLFPNINELLYRFNQSHDIFLGSWNYNSIG